MELDFDNIVSLSFEQLRNKFIKDEHKVQYYPDFGMVAVGYETEEYRRKFANWLNSSNKSELGPCYTDEGYLKPFIILRHSTTRLYFSSEPSNKTEAKTKFLAIANIIPKYDDKYYHSDIMYIDFFCAKRGMRLAPIMIKYFIENVYNTTKYWQLHAVPSAVKFWQNQGFKLTGDKNELDHDIMIWENQNVKIKKLKLSNNCYACEEGPVKYKDPITDLCYCSKDCFYILKRQKQNNKILPI